MRKAFFVFILLLFSASFSLAQTSLQVPAVDTNGGGVLTLIQAQVVAGSGGVFIDIEPFISVDTQQSAKLAAQVAAKEAGAELKNYDVLFKIIAKTEIVDGPSGGAGLTLLAYSEFTNRKPRPDLAITGTIERDGSVGQIGGVLEKTMALKGTNVKLFLIPKGQSVYQGRNVVAEAASFGVQVVEVRNLADAIKYAFTSAGSIVEPIAFQEAPLVLANLPVSQAHDPLKDIAVSELNGLKKKITALEKDKAGMVIAESARQALNESGLLIEKGYYYSAANAVFVAKMSVESFELKDVKQLDFLNLVKKTQDDADKMKSEFAQPTLENLEWVVGAKLRYYWASDKINEIKENSGLVDVQQLLPEYVSAKNWLAASRQMNDVAKTISSSNPNATQLNEAGAKQFARKLLDAVNESIGFAPDTEVIQHYYGGEMAFQDGEYATAFVDAVFAKSFVDTEKSISSKVGDEFIQGLLNASSLSQYNASLWAELYFIHSIYLVAEANRTNEFFYTTNALKLQDLSKNLAQQIPFLKGLMLQNVVEEETGVANGVKIQTTVTSQPSILFYVLAGFGFAVVVLVLVFMLRKPSLPSKPLSSVEKIEKIDEMLMHGKLSERNWEILHERYFKQLKSMERKTPSKPRRKSG
jgi:uncharacterized protein